MTDTNQLSVNIYLTEKFLGRCWHEFKGDTPTHYGRCIKCWLTAAYENLPDKGGNLNLFTPDGFFLLKAEMDKGDFKLGSFLKHHTDARDTENMTIFWSSVNSLTFPTLLATYLGWKE